MLFEWDESKNKKNIQKHKISFELASLVFLDKDRIDRFDIAHSKDEERRYTIGMVNDILFVVYMIRGKNTRLISARKANKKERLEYGNSKNGTGPEQEG